MIPTQLTLHKKSKTLEVAFDNGDSFTLSCEYLRVFSPSAEARKHPELITDKEHVTILAIEPVGQYAVKFIFSDGHRTGIYSWETLYELGKQYERNWQTYKEKVACNKKP